MRLRAERERRVTLGDAGEGLGEAGVTVERNAERDQLKS